MALKYVERKKGVKDTDTDEIITPEMTVKWRQYERWLKKSSKDNPHFPVDNFTQ